MSALPRDHVFAGLPAKQAGAILVDVPWHFKSYTPDISSREVFADIGLIMVPDKREASP